MDRSRWDGDDPDYRLTLSTSERYRAQCMDEIAAARAAFDAHKARFAVRRPSGVDRICQSCRGTGQLTDRHAYGPDCHIRCHACDGHGYVA